MSFSDSSPTDWKESKMKMSKSVKQELSKVKYSQKFCEKWMKVFTPWLTRCEDDPNKPFCRACQCRLDSNRCHLQRHERTTKHARNLEILISKGEGAARQNLSIRQERSRYYQQRRKINSSTDLAQDTSHINFDSTEDYIEETDGETYFQFVQADIVPGNQYNDDNSIKQEYVSCGGLIGAEHKKTVVAARPKQNEQETGFKKERMKLLLQIQKDKNDLMDSFKDLMESALTQTSSRERNNVDLFFESVSSSVKALSPALIAEAKMRVSQLVCELELRGLTENEVKASPHSISNSVDLPADENSAGTFILNTPVAKLVQTETSCEAKEEFESLS